MVVDLVVYLDVYLEYVKAVEMVQWWGIKSEYRSEILSALQMVLKLAEGKALEYLLALDLMLAQQTVEG